MNTYVYSIFSHYFLKCVMTSWLRLQHWQFWYLLGNGVAYCLIVDYLLHGGSFANSWALVSHILKWKEFVQYLCSLAHGLYGKPIAVDGMAWGGLCPFCFINITHIICVATMLDTHICYGYPTILVLVKGSLLCFLTTNLVQCSGKQT